jgi:hypothetical protein
LQLLQESLIIFEEYSSGTRQVWYVSSNSLRRVKKYYRSSLKHIYIVPDEDYYLGSPASTEIYQGKNCTCKLVSVDCLDAILCLPLNANETLEKVQQGLYMRRVIKKSSYLSEDTTRNFDLVNGPIGKRSQVVAIYVWRHWLWSNEILEGVENEPDAFLNHSWYPDCVQHNLQGKRCFLQAFMSSEVLGDIEKDALRLHPAYNNVSVREREATKILHTVRQNAFAIAPLDYLLMFAYISKISLNFRPHVHGLYKKRLKVLSHNTTKVFQTLRVGMHVRRGDSCAHSLSNYEQKAWPLDSRAQFGLTRICYDTNVYVKALERVLHLAGNNRHIEVYLATDYSRSLLEEIQSNFTEIFRTVSWKYLDYSRNIFDYFGGDMGGGQNFIESPNNTQQGILGETAFADILHLSHSQIFIGHLGSRFGKIGWLQAVARHGSFVPFFSVDGHSPCCDIDEPCGEMTPYVVSMENCLAVFSPWSNHFERRNQTEYWLEGLKIRKYEAQDEQRLRSRFNI